MRATRLPKLLLKALRTDANTIAETPLTVQAVSGQTGNLIEVKDNASPANVLFSLSAAGVPTVPTASFPVTSLVESALRQATVTISAADIIATTAGKFGHAAGYPLVADPGAGKVVFLDSAIMSYTHDTAAYTAGGNITININGGAAVTGLVSAAATLGGTANVVYQFVPLSTAAAAMTANKGLNLVAAAAFTNPGTAAGTIKMIVTYRIVTL
jgi:hypothetical protein